MSRPAVKQTYGEPVAGVRIGALAGAGPLGPTCHWIDGEPSPDDACKCGAPVARDANGVRLPYCTEHGRRAWRRGGSRYQAGPPPWARA